jgi:hypothetical protein
MLNTEINIPDVPMEVFIMERNGPGTLVTFFLVWAVRTMDIFGVIVIGL